ncbi:hypothetical protein EWM64_g10244 [Hericium alpestre]|uniref:Uncharacterized protein n=1 Tax=Hericium alpestre TaxID=135208 RepID=A0A4Y9ZJC5_9AGAM|nr:hypothetical protein EWM64_g10244 [Hericium alpestre]
MPVPDTRELPISRVLQWLKQPGTLRPRTYIMVRPDPREGLCWIRNDVGKHPEYYMNFGGDSGTAPFNPLGSFGPPNFLSSDNMTRLRGHAQRPATDELIFNAEARIIDEAKYGPDSATTVTPAEQALVDVVTAFPLYDMSTAEGTAAAIADMQAKLLAAVKDDDDSTV